MNSIHGHDVMHMMLESDQQFTTESLKSAIGERFGKQARFHTCSAQNLDAEQLIEFLTQKGKFVPTAEGFSTQPEKICNH